MRKLKLNSVVKNYIYQMLYQIYVSIAPLITAPYISRVLKPQGIGIYSYAMTVAMYFALFSKLGIDNYGNREIATVRNDKNKLNKVFSEIEILHLMVSFVVAITYIFYAFFICKENNQIAIVFSVNLVSDILYLGWFFYGFECFKLISIRNIVIKTMTIIAVFVFVKNEGDLYKYAVIVVSGNLISAGVMWLYLPRYVRFVKVSIGNVFKHLKHILLLFLPSVAVSVYRYMDKIMIKSFANVKQLGFYENADKIIVICNVLIISVGVVMMPRISNLLSKKDYKRIKDALHISTNFTMFLAIPITFGLVAISKKFTPFFFGSDFAPSAGILSLLAITIPFMSYANVIRTQYLIPFRKDKIYTFSVVLGAIINVIANYLFIPVRGAIGAALGTICAEISVWFVQFVFSWSYVNHVKLIKSGLAYVAIGAVMYVIVCYLSSLTPNSLFGIVLDVSVGVIIYIGMCTLYYTAVKDSELRALVNSIIKK